jgi:hypothetical protein
MDVRLGGHAPLAGRRIIDGPVERLDHLVEPDRGGAALRGSPEGKKRRES